MFRVVHSFKKKNSKITYPGRSEQIICSEQHNPHYFFISKFQLSISVKVIENSHVLSFVRVI